MHLGHDGVAQVERAEHLQGDLFQVPLVHFLDVEDGQQFVAGAAQGDVLADLDLGRVFFVHRQGNRHGEEVAVGQAHRVEDVLVVGLAHEAVER